MTEEQINTRLIFRPTEGQYKRLNKVFSKSDRYKHMSELLRHIVEIGLNELEKPR